MPPDIDNCVRRSLKDFPLKRRVRFHIGLTALQVFRKRGRKVAEHPFVDGLNALDRTLRNGLYAQAFLDKDFPTLRRFLALYWEEQAHHFHADWKDRFERMFLAHDQVIVEPISNAIANWDVQPELYEIGCGGGQVLAHFAEHLPHVSHLYGIDLGTEQTEINIKEFSDQPKLSFVAADAMKWIPENAKPNAILLSNGGVFEYFLEEELRTLFAHMADLDGPSVIAIVETFGTDHDLEDEPHSLPYGRELSFSHNYPSLVKEAGYTITHQSERTGFDQDGGGRWIRVVACKE